MEHYTSLDVDQKAAIVERRQRDLQGRLFRMMYRADDLDWVSKLPAAVAAINKTSSRVLRMTPEQARNPKNSGKVLKAKYGKALARRYGRLVKKRRPFAYDIGTIVRIQRHTGPMYKSYYGSFTGVLYRIYDRSLHFFVPIYKLETLFAQEKVQGTFYEQELRKVSLPIATLDDKIKNVIKITGYRYDNLKEQAQVTFRSEPNKRVWIDFDQLVGYDA